MSKYIGFIPQGFSEVTPEVLRSEIENFSTIKLEKYHIIFESNEHMDKIKRLDMFETSYVLIQYFQNNYNLESQFTWCIDHHEQLSKAIQTFSGSKKFRFRIVASRKNLSGKKFLQDVNRLQNILKKNHEILIDTGKPDYEIRLIEKENYGFIGIRIGKPPAYIDAFQKKGVRKEIARYLLHLSEPKDPDIFLDPMCGSGIIPIMRANLNKYERIFASDRNTAKIEEKINSLQRRYDAFEIVESELENLELDTKVNKIVTDPPWGRIEKISDLAGFYKMMFDRFFEISIDGAVIVIITSCVEIVEDYLSKNRSKFSLIATYRVKVSGMDARVYKLLRLS